VFVDLVKIITKIDGTQVKIFKKPDGMITIRIKPGVALAALFSESAKTVDGSRALNLSRV